MGKGSRVGPAGPAITRRRLCGGALAAVCGAAIAGCGRPSQAAAPPPRQAGVFALPWTFAGRVPGLVAAYGRERGIAVEVLDGYHSAGPNLAIDWASEHGLPALTDYRLVALDQALRASNFDAGQLLPLTSEMRDAVADSVFGLPLQLSPLGVRWRADVWQAAGLASPEPDWTWDDFVQACAAVAELVAAGTVPGLRSVLPVMVEDTDVLVNQDGRFAAVFPTNGAQDHLWPAFVLGYGGHVVRDGTFDVANAGALTGLAKLVAWEQRFGADPATLPRTLKDAQAYPQTYAVAIDYASSLGGLRTYGANWRWARLPRLPRPLVPVQVLGLGVHPFLLGRVQGDLQAQVDFLVWLLGPTAQGLLGKARVPPVAADPHVQDAFWGRQAGGLSAVGDWQNFADVHAGWPAIPPQPVTDPDDGQPPPTVDTARFITAAIWRAVLQHRDLDQEVAAATDQLNAWLTQNAANMRHPDLPAPLPA